MVVPLGIRYFFGVLKSSLNHQPPMFTGPAVGLFNSSVSTVGGSVWVNASVITIGAMAAGSGLAVPGVPSTALLGRHCREDDQSSGSAFSSTITSEKPRPSVI